MEIEGLMHCKKHGIYWEAEFGENCPLCTNRRIDRLEKALRKVLLICEDGDTGAAFVRVVEAMNFAHAALVGK